MNRVFITGGAGFIGHHLVKRLLADDKEVVVYDCLKPLSAAKDRLKGYILNNTRGFKFVHGDILHTSRLMEAMQGCDTVFHLAANGDIPAGLKNPYLDINNNVIGTHNVLEAMRQLKIGSLLYSSTAAVYGENDDKIWKETDAPLFPISLYGGSKLASEAMVSAYAEMYGINALIFRFSNVIGGGMDHGVIHDLIQRALTTYRFGGTEFEVWGDGKGIKPYFMVEDCIAGMLVAYRAACETSFPIGPVDIFNLGTKSASTVADVVSAVMDALREYGIDNLRPKYTGGRYGFNGDVPVVFYNTDKMNALGWKVSCDSHSAIAKTARLLASELISK